MKLFVDDIRNAPDETWVVARTITEAVRIISQQIVEVISLDHDISHQVHMDTLSRPYPCQENFSAIAYYLGALYGFRNIKQPTIILHTANPVGAKNMASILSLHGLVSEIKPFEYDDEPVEKLN